MRTSLSVPDELSSWVDEVSSSFGENNAQAVREALDYGRQLEERADDLEAENERLRERIEDLERDVQHERARADDLRRQLQEARSHEERVDELATFVETERTLQERRLQASLVERTKWRLFGMPDDVLEDKK